MLLYKIHQILAEGTEDFRLKIFEHSGLSESIKRVLDLTGKCNKRKCPLPAQFMMYLVLGLILYRQLSIMGVLEELINLLKYRIPELPLKSVTNEAIIHARERLSAEPLKWLFKERAALIQPEPSFRGLRVWGIDGSRMDMPDTLCNEKKFGRPGASRGHSAFPQLLCVCLVDTTTHRISDCIFAPCRESEKKLATKLLSSLGSGDLLITDRGFAALWLYLLYFERHINFLCRIPASWKPHIVKELGTGDYLVKISARVPLPEAEQRPGKKTRKVELKLRMIEYTIDGKERIRLLTNLLDPDKFPAIELATLYHQRWECELAYDELKNHFATVTHGTLCTLFRSKSPEGVLQEGYAMITAYNLVREMIAVAAKEHQIPPLEISFVEAFRAIELTFQHMEAASSQDFPILMDQLFHDIAACRMKRPRRKRRYPRCVKQKMSNFRVKKREYKEEKYDFHAKITLVGGSITL